MLVYNMEGLFRLCEFKL